MELADQTAKRNRKRSCTEMTPDCNWKSTTNLKKSTRVLSSPKGLQCDEDFDEDFPVESETMENSKVDFDSLAGQRRDEDFTNVATNLPQAILKQDVEFLSKLGLKSFSFQVSNAIGEIDSKLVVLFEREEDVYDDCMKFSDLNVLGFNQNDFEALVVHYFEHNASKHGYSQETTNLAIRYYIQYVASIVERLREGNGEGLPSWFYVMAAIACQRLAIKFEEGAIEDVSVLQIESNGKCSDTFNNFNKEGHYFTSEMVVWSESMILNELQWNMNVTTPPCFVEGLLTKLYLEYNIKLGRVDLPSCEYVHFILQLARKDFALSLACRASVVASGAIVVANDILRSISKQGKTKNTGSSASSDDRSGFPTFIDESSLKNSLVDILMEGWLPFQDPQKELRPSMVQNDLETCVQKLKDRILCTHSSAAPMKKGKAILPLERSSRSPSPVPGKAILTDARSYADMSCIRGASQESYHMEPNSFTRADNKD